MRESEKTIDAGRAPMAFHARLTNLDERFECDREQHRPRKSHDAREGPAVLQAPARLVQVHGHLARAGDARLTKSRMGVVSAI